MGHQHHPFIAALLLFAKMTRISYIHDIPGNEIADRLAEVPRTPAYIPFSQMTTGEFELAQLRERAAIYAAAFPENAALRQTVYMIDNALYRSVHNGTAFVGAIPDEIQHVAYMIMKAKTRTAPAAADLYGGRNLAQGIRIGDDIIPASIPGFCSDYATEKMNKQIGKSHSRKYYEALPPIGYVKNKWNEYRAECDTIKAVEKIVNARIVESSHHVLYKSINPAFSGLTNRVDVKRLLHISGVGALANVTSVKEPQMDAWVETSILRQNANQKVGLADSVKTSLFLAPDPEKSIAEYYAGDGKTRGGSQINGHIGEPVTIAAITALLTVLVTALGKAAEMQKELNNKRAGAMAAAQGFGTTAFKSEQGDWAGGSSGQSTSNKNTPIIIGGAAVALWLLTQK